MPVIPSNPPLPPPRQPGGSCSFKAEALIQTAMIEIGVLDPREIVSGPDVQFALQKLNAMLDAWNTDRKLVYTEKALTLANGNLPQLLTQPNPQTIGPTGNLVQSTDATQANYSADVNQRPVRITSANIILNYGTTSAVRQPLHIRDKDWWDNERAYTVSGNISTDLYYEPDWPNGSCYFWIVPNVAYQVELWIWKILDQLQLTSVFCMPPGYEDAVVYELAKRLCPSFQAPWTPVLDQLHRKAMERISSLNIQSPRINTNDSGVSASRDGKSYFNFESGAVVPGP